MLSNAACYAIFDLSPVAEGHMLIIPKRHAPTFFDLTAQERRDMNDLILRCKDRLDKSLMPGGYNIGLNCGVVAGQSVPVVPEFLRTLGVVFCVRFSSLPVWCRRVGTCPGNVGWTSRCW
ncbi:HIT family protein [Bifidobacterium mongoliense]|uniref:HIT family protein n=1 Tax=Bifidobacterium mongoliense TaxID=518643 RepID=UPI0034570778